MQKGTLCKSVGCYINCTVWLEKYTMPLLLLFMRIYMARVFWYSGLTKISSWDSTLYLFQYEYKVPILPPEFAAVVSTMFELACPIFLTLGLATRLASLPLIAMTAVMQIVSPDIVITMLWFVMLFTIFCYGPSKISIDYLILKRCNAKQ